MSDNPQAEGWWEASDGKWYPPESRPAPSPPPPPPSSDHQVGPGWWLASDGHWYPPTGHQPMSTTAWSPDGTHPTTPSLSRGLSGTLQGFLWVACGVSVLFAVFGFSGLAAFNRWWDDPRGRGIQEVQDADNAITGLVGVGVIVAPVIFVLTIIWSYQAHRVSERLWGGDRTWSSGWTIGGWFIPLANAVIPKLVLDEVERIAAAPRVNGTAAPDWRKQSTSALGWTWWITFVIFYGLAVVGIGTFDDPEGGASTWRMGYVLLGIGGIGLTVSSVAGALYIRKLTRALDG